MFLLSIPIPSRSGCTDDFKETMDRLEALINTHGTDKEVIFLGDFNADPGKEGGPLSSKDASSLDILAAGVTAQLTYNSTRGYYHTRM